jgi:hypothetical protein
MMAAEVGRWMGAEEGAKWLMGLKVLMPLLLNLVSDVGPEGGLQWRGGGQRRMGGKGNAAWHSPYHHSSPLLPPPPPSQERPCARLGEDVLTCPINLIKAKDSWSRTRIQELYDPEGLADYSWSAFSSWGEWKGMDRFR